MFLLYTGIQVFTKTVTKHRSKTFKRHTCAYLNLYNIKRWDSLTADTVLTSLWNWHCCWWLFTGYEGSRNSQYEVSLHHTKIKTWYVLSYCHYWALSSASSSQVGHWCFPTTESHAIQGYRKAVIHTDFVTHKIHALILTVLFLCPKPNGFPSYWEKKLNPSLWLTLTICLNIFPHSVRSSSGTFALALSYNQNILLSHSHGSL